MLPLPIFLIALLAIALVISYVYFGRQASRQAGQDWATLIARLRPMPGRGVDAVADTYLHPRLNQIELEPETIYQLLGGVEGMRTMHQNAQIMLELAGYATRWNQVEATIVSEMIRRDARRLRHALLMVRVDMLWQNFTLRTPFRMQEAAAAYQLMSYRLCALYEASHVGLYPKLAQAL